MTAYLFIVSGSNRSLGLSSQTQTQQECHKFSLHSQITSKVNMSWNGYIDTILQDSSGSCDAAALISLEGQSWTTNDHASHLSMSSEEMVTIAKGMSSNDMSSSFASGITVGGVTYQILRADGGAVFGKRRGNGAITLEKTNTGIIIGHTIEGKDQGGTNVAVNKMAIYIKSLGM